ncbi:MAG TPA: hypothetical protein DCY13_17430, partial [Verrucomicrobiales bacterium]|nr:hypothetical protein [Verrucomicrobiales bacterium]
MHRLFEAPATTLAVLACLAGTLGLPAAEAGRTGAPLETLTNVQAVLALGAEGGRLRAPVRLEVVVTYVRSVAQSFYAEDSNGAVLVHCLDSRYRPVQGQRIAIDGFTAGTRLGAVVEAVNVRVLGTAPLPPHKLTTAEALATGRDFGRRVALRGRVRDLRVIPGRMELLLNDGTHHFFALVRHSEMTLPIGWIDAQLEVRGVGMPTAEVTSGTSGPVVYPLGTNDLTVLSPGLTNVFDAPPLIRPVGRSDARLRASGVVTFKSAEQIFIETPDGPLGGSLLAPIHQDYPNSLSFDHS